MIWDLGEFELDDNLLELRRAGVRVSVRPKALKLLLHLVQNSSRVVPSDELLRVLWPGVNVTEASLRQTVRALRSALGTKPGNQIVSLRGTGYRLHASARPRDARAPTGSDSSRTCVDDASAGASFVGRVAELTQMLICAEKAVSGHGQLVLVAGSPGMGKTRLAEELVGIVPREMRAVWGRCWEHGGSPPFWPWDAIIRGISGDARSSPELAELLLEGRTRADALPYSNQEPHTRFRLFASTTARIRSHAEKEPLLVILDDLHAAEDSALLLLKFLSRELATMRVLLVGTYRAEDIVEREHSAALLDGLPTSLRIALHAFGPDDVSAYMESTGMSRPADAVVTRLHELSGGNPLFLREFLRFGNGTAHPTSPALDWIAYSRTPLRDAILRHLRPLSTRARALLSTGAIMGTTFELVVLRKVLAWPDEELVECSSQAMAARLVDEISPGVFRFCHSVIRDLLYHDLPPVDRQRLHARTGEAMVALGRGEHARCTAAIAHHFLQCLPTAGSPKLAIDYLVRAAESAATRMAHEEARDHYRKALDLLDHTAPPERHRFELTLRLVDSERLCGALIEAQARARAAVDWAREHGTAQDLAQAVLAFARAHPDTGVVDGALMRLLEDVLAILPNNETSDRAGSTSDTSRALMEQRVVLLARLAVLQSFSRESSRCLFLANEAVTSARQIADVHALGQALSARIFCLLGRPHADAQRLLVEAQQEALALTRTCRDADTTLELMGWGYTTLLHLGQIERATEELVRYEQLSRSARRPLHEWYLMSIRTAQSIWTGDFAHAERLAADAFDYGTRTETPVAGSYLGGHLFQIRRDQGRLDELLPSIKQNVDAYPTVTIWRAGLAIALLETGNADGASIELQRAAHKNFDDLVYDMHWACAVALYGEVSAGLGDSASARRIYQLLLPMAPRVLTTGAVNVVVGLVSQVLGQLALVLGDASAAAEHFQAAAALAARMGAHPWIARANWGLARAHAACGGRAGDSEAVAAARRAYTAAARLGMSALVNEIQVPDRDLRMGTPYDFSSDHEKITERSPS